MIVLRLFIAKGLHERFLSYGVEAEVLYQPIKILYPQRSKEKYDSVLLTAIEIKEKSDRNSEEIIHWKLLTTLEVESSTDALKCVRWYTYRWLIERFHYVIKSGTKIEELQLKQAESLQKAIIVYSLPSESCSLFTKHASIRK